MGEKPCGRCDDGDCTAEDFAKYFSDKVDTIRSETSTTPLQDIPDTASHVIDEWSPVTALEVEKLISSSLNKTCQLDPAPTWLIKEQRSLLSPFIALLFNKSLTTGSFPKKYGHAIVFPLLKKEQPRRQPTAELSSSLKPTISVETSGKSRSDAVAEVPRRS